MGCRASSRVRIPPFPPANICKSMICKAKSHRKVAFLFVGHSSNHNCLCALVRRSEQQFPQESKTRWMRSRTLSTRARSTHSGAATRPLVETGRAVAASMRCAARHRDVPAGSVRATGQSSRAAAQKTPSRSLSNQPAGSRFERFRSSQHQ